MNPGMNEEGGVVVTKLNDLLNWARMSSLWPLSFGIACCAIEMMGSMASTYDFDRFGVFPRPSARQADVIIIAGTVTFKMAERIKRLYEQMPDPKYVISMGSCSNCGGPYWQHGYHVVKGVDRVIPVDVYVQGCPPRPEALIGAVLPVLQAGFVPLIDKWSSIDLISKSITSNFNKFKTSSNGSAWLNLLSKENVLVIKVHYQQLTFYAVKNVGMLKTNLL